MVTQSSLFMELVDGTKLVAAEERYGAASGTLLAPALLLFGRSRERDDDVQTPHHQKRLNGPMAPVY